MHPAKWLCTILVAVATYPSFAQQLRLGSNPYTVEKSAVLELQSTNQGLLLSRISDTAIINALTPPDGMVIFFTPLKQLMVRSNNQWKVVRAKTPLYYSGSGATANTEEITKIWIAEITYSSTNPTQTISIPSNVGFTAILGIQLTAKGGSGVTTAPIASVVSNTTSSIVIRVVESKTSSIGALGGTAEGLEQHTDNTTKIYVRVEGY